MSAAATTFDRICARPSMFGDPAQVETGLWVCMSIWVQEHPIDEASLQEAMMTVRRSVPALNDRSGLSFHDLSMGRLDYEPVVRNMRAVFDILQKQVL